MNRDVSAACQMFLIPSTILFGALGAAQTEPLKFLISLTALLSAVIWLYVISNWPKITLVERRASYALALVCLVAWAASSYVHGGNAFKEWQKLGYFSL